MTSKFKVDLGIEFILYLNMKKSIKRRRKPQPPIFSNCPIQSLGDLMEVLENIQDAMGFDLSAIKMVGVFQPSYPLKTTGIVIGLANADEEEDGEPPVFVIGLGAGTEYPTSEETEVVYGR